MNTVRLAYASGNQLARANFSAHGSVRNVKKFCYFLGTVCELGFHGDYLADLVGFQEAETKNRKMPSLKPHFAQETNHHLTSARPGL